VRCGCHGSIDGTCGGAGQECRLPMCVPPMRGTSDFPQSTSPSAVSSARVLGGLLGLGLGRLRNWYCCEREWAERQEGKKIPVEAYIGAWAPYLGNLSFSSSPLGLVVGCPCLLRIENTNQQLARELSSVPKLPTEFRCPYWNARPVAIAVAAEEEEYEIAVTLRGWSTDSRLRPRSTSMPTTSTI
jgi:hypothetical protein